MSLQRDLKYSLRLLRKTPFHSAMTVFVMAVGLSLYLTTYTLAKMQTDIQLPFPEGDSYVVLKSIDPLRESDQWIADLYTYQRLKNISDKYSVLAAIQFSDAILSDDGGYSRQFKTATLSVEILSAAAVTPLLGRLFTADDSAPGAANVTIISYDLWQEYYGGKPDIIGTTSLVNNQLHNIIGVMREGFSFPVKENLWLPLRFVNGLQPGEGGAVQLAGILRQGTGHEAAEAELNVLLAQLVNEFPDDYTHRTALITPYAQGYGNIPLNMGLMMLVLAYIILALTTVNLSSLFFMRSISRKQELAVRATMGAGGWELAKQVLLESFILCLAGLLLSLLVSFVLLGILGSFDSDEPFWYIYEINLQTALTGLLVTITVWLSAGLFVAYKAGSTQPGNILTNTNKGSGGGNNGVASKVIVTVEVILSCILLIFSGITINAMQRTTVTDYGVNTENMAVGRFSLSYYASRDHQIRLSFIDNLIFEVAELVDITDAAVTTAPPGKSGLSGKYQVEELRNSVDIVQWPRQDTVWVGDHYFDAIGLNLIEGRGFDGSDSASSPHVVIITEEFALQLWPQQSSIDKTIIAMINGEEKILTVIGTIPTLMQTNSTIALFLEPTLYRPITQESPEDLFLIVQHRPQAIMAELEQTIRTASARANRNVAIEEFQSVDDLVVSNDARFYGLFFGTFLFGTLLLAAIGVYAVLSRSITERTREIGVRRALGSTNFSIFLKFNRQGMGYLLAGIIVGSIPAVLVWIYIATTFFEATSFSAVPFVWLAVTLVMFTIIAVACYLPTRMAIKLDPGEALQYE